MSLTLTPPPAIETPDGKREPAVGNDGLTDAERDEYAAAYQRHAVRPLTNKERATIAQWREHARDRTDLA